MAKPFDVQRAELTWFKRQAERLDRHRFWLLWAPLGAIPVAAAGAYAHPLLGGAIMAVVSICWLFVYSRNIDTRARVSDKITRAQTKTAEHASRQQAP